MHTMAEKQIDMVLIPDLEITENNSEKWMYHSQAIAVNMSNRMEELGMFPRC